MLFVLSTTRVTNSRFFKRQNTVWRRRQTPDGVVFTTRETLDYEQITVVSGNDSRDKYKPGLLFSSILSACDHLHDAEDIAWQIKTTVEEKLVDKLDESLTITTRQISETTIQTLKLYNTSAYVKYASYHPDIVSSRKLAAALK